MNFFFFTFWLWCQAWGILFPNQVQPARLAMEAQSLNHRTVREFMLLLLLIESLEVCKLFLDALLVFLSPIPICTPFSEFFNTSFKSSIYNIILSYFIVFSGREIGAVFKISLQSCLKLQIFVCWIMGCLVGLRGGPGCGKGCCFGVTRHGVYSISFLSIRTEVFWYLATSRVALVCPGWISAPSIGCISLARLQFLCGWKLILTWLLSQVICNRVKNIHAHKKPLKRARCVDNYLREEEYFQRKSQ